jgi:chemotaxis protein histidine kinase CheA
MRNLKPEIQMSEFRQNFLAESIDNLTILQKQLAEDFTENLRREAFRTIHTIKGGAQTFGLEASAGLAEELENILSNRAASFDKKLLLEGLDFLKGSLRGSVVLTDTDFLEKLQNAGHREARSNVLLSNIPPEVFRNFSEQERAATVSALRDGKHIYCAEAGFALANFADEYRKLRKILSEKSDILASLPSEKYKSEGKIGFRIFLASREPAESLRKSVEGFMIEISSHACADNHSKDLYKMLSQIAAHGEKTAAKLGKQINITILSNDVRLSAGQTKAFFDILLHLVRNAADHAIEQSGNIEVRFFEEPEGLYLSVADDGCGIDLQKVRAVAVAKNLISDDDFLNEQEMLGLIFAPEFSTATALTEISGRGVGLDAVKNAVEKMNGKISVKKRKTNGTIFEIFVPRENNI